jgi:hypothetical protein
VGVDFKISHTLAASSRTKYKAAVIQWALFLLAAHEDCEGGAASKVSMDSSREERRRRSGAIHHGWRFQCVRGH